MAKSLHLLFISGSLKSSSTNTALLHTLQELQPANVRSTIYGDLEHLPPFHPERDEGSGVVRELRRLVGDADAVLISTPEYAFGVPGVLKNALDWMVSSGEFNEKPVAAISASPLSTGGNKALQSLLLTLDALGTRSNAQCTLSIANVNAKVVNGKVTDQDTLSQLNMILNQLLKLIAKKS